MKEEKSEGLKECPVCKEKTFQYDTELGANRCRSEFCGWDDKVLPAIDLPISYLERGYEETEPGPHKEKLRKIIDATKKIREEVGLTTVS